MKRKQDLTPTNENTQLKTRRHSISCILVPRHGHGHDNQPRHLKSPINSIFILLDPFYHPHFAFPFGLPAVPYCSRRTQCPKYDFCLNTFAESLKHGAPVLSRYYNSDHAGSAQNLTILSPIVLPLNPFQSFVLFGTVGGGTTRSDNSDVYPCWSMFGGLKPPTNKRPAAYYI